MTGCGWKLREASQGGVRRLGTAEAVEIAGVLGSVETGAWEEHGRWLALVGSVDGLQVLLVEA